MLLMVEKHVKEGICHSIYRYVKANNKYMKDYEKIKESSYIQYWDVNNLFGCVMSQKLPVKIFEWIKDNFQFNEHFSKNYNEESDKGYFLQVNVYYIKKTTSTSNESHFLSARMKVEKLAATLRDKTEYLIH